MALSPRFTLDTTAVLASGFLAVSAMAFTPHTAGWLSFGVSAAAVLAAAAGTVSAERTSQKAGHALLALAGLWSLAAAVTFTGSTLTWLVLANALALGTTALGDLIGHELTTERVVHALDVHSSDKTAAATALPTAAAA